MTAKHVPVKVGHVTGYLTTVTECHELIRQAEAAIQIIQTKLIIRAPRMSDGYISRDEFCQFMRQFMPDENARRGTTGAKIFGLLLRAVLSEKVVIDIRCSRCGGSVTEACKPTNRRHIDTSSIDIYSISLYSLKSRLNRVRTLEGVTQERYEMITELVKFA